MRKEGNYENHQHNFARMEDMDNWFIIRDSSQHRQNAIGGDVAIQTQPEVDLLSKLALDGLSYFDYHISTQFGF